MSDECHQDFVNFILACEFFHAKKSRDPRKLVNPTEEIHIEVLGIL